MDSLSELESGILAHIGNTPLVRLDHLFHDAPFSVFGKLEMFNPGGSIKDRTALSILVDAIRKGKITRGTTLIESSSGNLGIGLAYICKYLGIRFVCVVDPKTTAQNLAILNSYGAEVELVREPHPVSKDYLHARLERVRQLLDAIPGGIWTDQYSNLACPAAHYPTMREIIAALDGESPDFLFVATSTCGTLRGCSEFIRDYQLKTRVIAVDAEGSCIFGGKRARRLIPGHGAAIVPPLLKDGLCEFHINVPEIECISGCRRLLAREAILAGGSSGAIVAAIESCRNKFKEDAKVVALFADGGERYLDTIYDDSWVRSNYGEISRLWETGASALATA